MYNALCGEYGADSIYLMGSTNVDEPDGHVFLDILNPSEEEAINGRLSFTE